MGSSDSLHKVDEASMCELCRDKRVGDRSHKRHGPLFDYTILSSLPAGDWDRLLRRTKLSRVPLSGVLLALPVPLVDGFIPKGFDLPDCPCDFFNAPPGRCPCQQSLRLLSAQS
jgi:hypothetical protein